MVTSRGERADVGGSVGRAMSLARAGAEQKLSGEQQGVSMREQIKERTLTQALMVSLALEAGLSGAALWALVADLSLAASSGRAWAAMFFLCLMAVQGVRTMRAMAWFGAGEQSLRLAAVGALISLVGWIAMLVIFALHTLFPELEVDMRWMIPAFLCHIGGALLALYQLRPRGEDRDEE